ncbi:MAG: UDP-N-acetylglucosamine--N-acetylmuramyl-(pentapeptide) pyrophosphoryl-undecaprenol N-acetylglucosamine transferase, partial [Zoogloea sp.]
GATALNECVPKALALLAPEDRPLVTHQAGTRQIEALKQAYAQAGVTGELLPFIEDMAARYAEADLVICRSGALTVAELAAVGVASVLVPFPHAVDDHQTGNARFLADAGAACLLPQTELNPQRLAALLQEMNRVRLLEMASMARGLARADATAEVAELCASLAKA